MGLIHGFNTLCKVSFFFNTPSLRPSLVGGRGGATWLPFARVYSSSNYLSVAERQSSRDRGLFLGMLVVLYLHHRTTTISSNDLRRTSS